MSFARILGKAFQEIHSPSTISHHIHRTSFGKNILKIFGNADPQLIDPEAELIHREAAISEKLDD